MNINILCLNKKFVSVKVSKINFLSHNLLTSFEISINLSTSSFAYGKFSPKHREPQVNTARSFILADNFPLLTISMRVFSSLCFDISVSDSFGKGRGVDLATSDKAVHEDDMRRACELSKVLAENNKSKCVMRVIQVCLNLLTYQAL